MENAKGCFGGAIIFLGIILYFCIAITLYCGGGELIFGIKSETLGTLMIIFTPLYPPGFLFWSIVLLVIGWPFILIYYFLLKTK